MPRCPRLSHAPPALPSHTQLNLNSTQPRPPPARLDNAKQASRLRAEFEGQARAVQAKYEAQLRALVEGAEARYAAGEAGRGARGVCRQRRARLPAPGGLHACGPGWQAALRKLPGRQPRPAMPTGHARPHAPAELAEQEARQAAHVQELMGRHAAALADMRAYYNQARGRRRCCCWAVCARVSLGQRCLLPPLLGGRRQGAKTAATPHPPSFSSLHFSPVPPRRSTTPAWTSSRRSR